MILKAQRSLLYLDLLLSNLGVLGFVGLLVERLEHLDDAGDGLAVLDDAHVDPVKLHEVGADVEDLVVVGAGAENGEVAVLLARPPELEGRSVLLEADACRVQLVDQLLVTSELLEDLLDFLVLYVDACLLPWMPLMTLMTMLSDSCLLLEKISLGSIA